MKVRQVTSEPSVTMVRSACRVQVMLLGSPAGSAVRIIPAFDPIATHTGVMVSVTGLPDQPIKSGISVADSGTGRRPSGVSDY